MDLRSRVFARDKYTCRVCSKKWDPSDADPALFRMCLHPILDRTQMPGGGQVPENHITVCSGECLERCEEFHLSGGARWEQGLHPDDLFGSIGTSLEEAIRASIRQMKRGRARA